MGVFVSAFRGSAIIGCCLFSTRCGTSKVSTAASSKELCAPLTKGGGTNEVQVAGGRQQVAGRATAFLEIQKDNLPRSWC